MTERTSLPLEIIFTDGGSRGNPGPAAAGFVVRGIGYGEFLGIATNNYAEYSAIIFALKKLKALVGSSRAKMTDVEIRTDSQLAVRQLNRVYKVEHPDIIPLFVQVLNLAIDFHSVVFVHIPREQNAVADSMVNQCLDNQRTSTPIA